MKKKQEKKKKPDTQVNSNATLGLLDAASKNGLARGLTLF